MLRACRALQMYTDSDCESTISVPSKPRSCVIECAAAGRNLCVRRLQTEQNQTYIIADGPKYAHAFANVVPTSPTIIFPAMPCRATHASSAECESGSLLVSLRCDVTKISFVILRFWQKEGNVYVCGCGGMRRREGGGRVSLSK